MTTFSGPPAAAIRNKPISAALQLVLQKAATSSGISAVVITSGGQDALGHGTRRTGSTRHDNGRAADLQLIVNGRKLSFTNQAADPTLISFITAAAAAGANGIGAGVDYMGPYTIHVGFGTSVSDNHQLTWGADGLSANAPAWLRTAAKAGWDTPITNIQPASIDAGDYVVIARDGLKLRGGPGTDFQSSLTLERGRRLRVLDVSTQYPDWASVDLQNDGLRDGYVFASFLAPIP